jgi:hypothetical protein
VDLLKQVLPLLTPVIAVIQIRRGDLKTVTLLGVLFASLACCAAATQSRGAARSTQHASHSAKRMPDVGCMWLVGVAAAETYACYWIAWHLPTSASFSRACPTAAPLPCPVGGRLRRACPAAALLCWASALPRWRAAPTHYRFVLVNLLVPASTKH